MKIDDIDKDMHEVKASIAAAYKAFQEEDYVTAAKLYSSTAARLKQIYSPDHPETLKCLLLAGDSYFYLNRFSEAAEIYLELQAIVEKHKDTSVDKSVLFFKTAKSLEKAKRFDEASTAYEFALIACEGTLSDNHPLKTIVNESFGSFLRHIRKYPQAAIDYEDRAAELRERNKDIHGLYENYLEPLKRREEPVRSGNLHARPDGKGSSQSRPQQIVITPSKADDNDKSTANKALKIFAMSLLVLMLLGVAAGLGAKKAREEESAKPKPKAIVPTSGPNMISNGGFDAERSCDTGPAFLTGWTKDRDSVKLAKAEKEIGPTDGIQFANLGRTGQISHVFFTQNGASYTLLIDVATPALDGHPVIVYSLGSENWTPVNVEEANKWHTEAISFVSTSQDMKLRIASGYDGGTEERYIDNVRVFQNSKLQE